MSLGKKKIIPAGIRLLTAQAMPEMTVIKIHHQFDAGETGADETSATGRHADNMLSHTQCGRLQAD
jgi:hypothetical protein